MRIKRGMVVSSKAGHDKGLYFVVVDENEKGLLIADGKRRKVQKPKLKKPCHLSLVSNPDNGDSACTINEGEYLTNKEIKRQLRLFKEKQNFDSLNAN